MTEGERHQDVVRGKLAQIELDHEVEILFAVESGSRAWGFPSADSDWDARFVYRQKLPEYLRLLKRPDTIGKSVKGALYDVHGWDIAKALKLAVGSNSTLLEWLRSPLRYRWSEEARAVQAMCERLASARNLTWNYFNLTRNAWEETGSGQGETVSGKKYLYGLRSALTLRHLRMFPGVPPMNLGELMEATDPGSGETAEVNRLVQLKAGGEEMGQVKRSPRLDQLIRTEMEGAEATKPEKAQLVSDERLLALTETLFHKLIGAGASA